VALKGLFSYANLDSSRDYNAKTDKIVDRAILDGGVLTYSGLDVTIAPFRAVSFDGLTVISDTDIKVTLTTGQVNYIICYAKYQVQAQPFIEVQVINHATWTGSVDNLYFITFAKFDLTSGIYPPVSDINADYSVSDYSDKLGKGNWRKVAPSFATLPTIQNRDGDTRVALADRVSYTWNEATKSWLPTKTKAAQVVFAPYPGLVSTDVQAVIQEVLPNTLLASNAIQNDRVIYSTYALAGTNFTFFIPFIRKFSTPPTGVNITTPVAGEQNVTTAVVSSITIGGFAITVTATADGMTTLARDWVTV
jgi:hypothetical protein